MDSHQADACQNFITVIPVEYPRGSYPHDFPPGHIARDYVRERSREGYLRSKQQLQQQQLNSGTLRKRDEPSQFFPTNPPAGFEDDPPTANFHRGDVEHFVKGNSSFSCEREDSPRRIQDVEIKKSIEIGVFLHNSICVELEMKDPMMTTTCDMVNMLVQEEQLGLPPEASQYFTIWIISPKLEVQLKSHHHPLQVCLKWKELLSKYTRLDPQEKELEEPRLYFQRNVFLALKDEKKIRDAKVLELLYEEAKDNILDGRYPCEISDYEMLAGIQARLELGVFDAKKHTPEFIKSNLHRFLPDHVWKSRWIPKITWRQKGTPEHRILNQYRNVSSNGNKKLIKKYLEFCWSLPYYGSAFFKGQIEERPKGLLDFLKISDTDVTVAINGHGIYVMDHIHCTILLGIKYEDLSWDFAKPAQEKDPDCLPCLFLQFPTIETGHKLLKILQIFSKQAMMMDALISAFIEILKQTVKESNSDELDSHLYESNPEVDDMLVPLTTVTRRAEPNSCLSNKLQRLSLATFNEEGECVNQMGSWAFSR